MIKTAAHVALWVLLISFAFIVDHSTSRANDQENANRLFVEALKTWRSANHSDPSAHLAALRIVRDKLRMIVDEQPGSDLAVKLLLGEPIGPLSLPGLDQEIKELESELALRLARKAALERFSRVASERRFLAECEAALDPRDCARRFLASAMLGLLRKNPNEIDARLLGHLIPWASEHGERELATLAFDTAQERGFWSEASVDTAAAAVLYLKDAQRLSAFLANVDDRTRNYVVGRIHHHAKGSLPGPEFEFVAEALRQTRGKQQLTSAIIKGAQRGFVVRGSASAELETALGDAREAFGSHAVDQIVLNSLYSMTNPHPHAGWASKTSVFDPDLVQFLLARAADRQNAEQGIYYTAGRLERAKAGDGLALAHIIEDPRLKARAFAEAAAVRIENGPSPDEFSSLRDEMVELASLIDVDRFGDNLVVGKTLALLDARDESMVFLKRADAIAFVKGANRSPRELAVLSQAWTILKETEAARSVARLAQKRLTESSSYLEKLDAIRALAYSGEFDAAFDEAKRFSASDKISRLGGYYKAAILALQSTENLNALIERIADHVGDLGDRAGVLLEIVRIHKEAIDGNELNNVVLETLRAIDEVANESDRAHLSEQAFDVFFKLGDARAKRALEIMAGSIATNPRSALREYLRFRERLAAIETKDPHHGATARRTVAKRIANSASDFSSLSMLVAYETGNPSEICTTFRELGREAASAINAMLTRYPMGSEFLDEKMLQFPDDADTSSRLRRSHACLEAMVNEGLIEREFAVAALAASLVAHGRYNAAIDAIASLPSSVSIHFGNSLFLE